MKPQQKQKKIDNKTLIRSECEPIPRDFHLAAIGLVPIAFCWLKRYSPITFAQRFFSLTNGTLLNLAKYVAIFLCHKMNANAKCTLPYIIIDIQSCQI